jgi:NAD(P)-dependent dehydrogenase (short-subunit alcohol dehydrogenase family)
MPPSRPVCLVTGAARRLGRAIALELAAHGCDIAVHFRGSSAQARETAQLIAGLGARAIEFEADLADETACRALVGAVVSRFGRVDHVVNNASTFEADDARTFSHALMEQHWRVNTAPAVLLANALHGHVKERQAQGCVVNLIDQKLWNPNPDYLSYTLSKSALQTATVLLAQALAPELRVCGVAPGLTLPSTAMTPSQFEAARRMTPMQRSSTPQDVARAVRFLIESPAVTGTTLLVDGGQHLAAQPRDVVYLAVADTGTGA